MSRPLTLALAQVPGRRAGDLDGFAAHAKRVLGMFPDLRLLVYPELHLAGDDADPLDQGVGAASAEPLTTGPRHTFLADLAVVLGVWLCPGSVCELGADGYVYNTAVVYSPDGQLVAAYRKVFPWRPFEQARPGREFVVFDIPGTGRVGLSICYDAWFPETTRHLAWMGADLVINVVKTGTVDRAQEIVIGRANATVNQVFVASVNAAAPSGLGLSVVIGPEGNVLAELPGAGTGIVTAVIDLDSVAHARRFGSFGITRVWSQLREDDEPILLPLYDGALTPQRWAQANERNAGAREAAGRQPGAEAAEPDALTTGVPPAVTLHNWQHPDVLRWSYQHVGEILPSVSISAGAGPGVALPRGAVDLDHLDLSLPGGDTCSVADILARTHTDAWLVLHDGRVVAERYFGQMSTDTSHLLQSVSKSLVATVAGALVGHGLLDPAAPVADYVAELAATGYAGATVRQLLDMRSGIAFVEDYVDPSSDSRKLEAASGWAPVSQGGARTIRQFLLGLRQARPHGGRFEYRSCETTVLGWVCQAAANTWFPRLASDLVWSRLGARHDATITVDSEGTGAFDGGISATVADLARFGLMILGDGKSIAGEQVVPAAWVHDIFTGAPDSAEAFAAGPEATSMPGGRYRSQFWLPFADRSVAVCLGIHGQMIYLDRDAGVVAVKLSSWPVPEDSWSSAATMRMFAAISSHLGDLTSAEPEGAGGGEGLSGVSRRT